MHRRRPHRVRASSPRSVRPGSARRWLGAAAVRVLLAAVLGAGVGGCAPVGALPARAQPAAPGAARPTVDPHAPTPTAPYPAGPPTGTAPDGSTVGGNGLRTRGLVLADGAPALPEGIDAHGWLVADATSGAVLGARDPHGRYYPASTLKTLTLLTLAHRLDWNAVVTASPEDERMEGTRVGLVTGGRYPVWLLFQSLILASGNDAADALARAAGGVPQTVAAMNDTAVRLGACDTVAGTPSGLDVAGQSSSPYDLALIFRAVLSDPLTAGVLQVRSAQLPPVPERGKPGFQIQSQNPLLARYPGDLGGKNGFTDAARHTFVTAAERNGRRLVVSLMQAERRPVDVPDQAARLLDWGFGVPAGTPGVGRLVEPGEVPPSAAPPPSPRSAAVPTGARPATAAPAPGPGFPPRAGLLLAVAGVGTALAAGVVALRRARRRPPPSPPPGISAAAR